MQRPTGRAWCGDPSPSSSGPRTRPARLLASLPRRRSRWSISAPPLAPAPPARCLRERRRRSRPGPWDPRRCDAPAASPPIRAPPCGTAERVPSRRAEAPSRPSRRSGSVVQSLGRYSARPIRPVPREEAQARKTPICQPFLRSTPESRACTEPFTRCCRTRGCRGDRRAAVQRRGVSDRRSARAGPDRRRGPAPGGPEGPCADPPLLRDAPPRGQLQPAGPDRLRRPGGHAVLGRAGEHPAESGARRAGSDGGRLGPPGRGGGRRVPGGDRARGKRGRAADPRRRAGARARGLRLRRLQDGLPHRG